MVVSDNDKNTDKISQARFSVFGLQDHVDYLTAIVFACEHRLKLKARLVSVFFPGVRGVRLFVRVSPHAPRSSAYRLRDPSSLTMPSSPELVYTTYLQYDDVFDIRRAASVAPHNDFINIMYYILLLVPGL